MSDDIGDDESDEEIRRLDRQAEAARAIQRRLDVAVAKREAGPDERRLAAAYLSGRITLMPEAVEVLRRLGLVGEPPEEHDPFNP
jgi:hypothetical protein